MNFTDYQREAGKTNRYAPDIEILLIALGLSEEAGEVAGKVKKLFRDSEGAVTQEIEEAIVDELGDVLWYLSQIAAWLDISMDAVATNNIAKLRSRSERGKLRGSGDNR